MRLFCFNGGLDAVMVGRVEVPYLIGYAAVADRLEAFVNKAIVDQVFFVLFRLVAVEGIAHILGSCHIYIPVKGRHILVGGIIRAHIEVAGDDSRAVAQFLIILVDKLYTFGLTGISKAKVCIHKQKDLA